MPLPIVCDVDPEPGSLKARGIAGLKFRQSLGAHVENAREVARAIVEGRSIPPLVLKSGLTLHHRQEDPTTSLVREIFRDAAYTGRDFYIPHPGDVIIDGGANIGVFALYLISLERDLRIFCFEPCAQTLETLHRNIEANGLGDRIAVYPFALFSRETTMTLHMMPWSDERSLFESGTRSTSVPEEEVRCIGLSAALDLCRVQRIDLLKLDVEGSELDILEASADLDWSRIRRIAVEYHETIRPGGGRRIAGLLREFGFTRIEFTDNPTAGIIRAAR